MSKFLSAVFKRIVPYMNYIMVAALLVIFITLSLHVYRRLIRPQLKVGNDQKFQDVSNIYDNGKTRPVELHLFYATWCPACQKQKPEWDAFQKRVETDPLKNADGTVITIVFRPHDCTNTEEESVAELVDAYSVNKYPTVIGMNTTGDRIEFDALITQTSLEQFVQSLA